MRAKKTEKLTKAEQRNCFHDVITTRRPELRMKASKSWRLLALMDNSLWILKLPGKTSESSSRMLEFGPNYVKIERYRPQGVLVEAWPKGNHFRTSALAVLISRELVVTYVSKKILAPVLHIRRHFSIVVFVLFSGGVQYHPQVQGSLTSSCLWHMFILCTARHASIALLIILGEKKGDLNPHHIWSLDLVYFMGFRLVYSFINTPSLVVSFGFGAWNSPQVCLLLLNGGGSLRPWLHVVPIIDIKWKWINRKTELTGDLSDLAVQMVGSVTGHARTQHTSYPWTPEMNLAAGNQQTPPPFFFKLNIKDKGCIKTVESGFHIDYLPGILPWCLCDSCILMMILLKDLPHSDDDDDVVNGINLYFAFLGP